MAPNEEKKAKTQQLRTISRLLPCRAWELTGNSGPQAHHRAANGKEDRCFVQKFWEKSLSSHFADPGLILRRQLTLPCRWPDVDFCSSDYALQISAISRMQTLLGPRVMPRPVQVRGFSIANYAESMAIHLGTHMGVMKPRQMASLQLQREVSTARHRSGPGIWLDASTARTARQVAKGISW